MIRIAIACIISLFGLSQIRSQSLPSKIEVISQLKLANKYWMDINANPGNNRWARSVYFTGLMDFYSIYPDENYLKYINLWANQNNWSLWGGDYSRHADHQCAGQVYFDLYMLDEMQNTDKIDAICTSITDMVGGDRKDDWWWIDAMYMAMPVFVRLGILKNDDSYWYKMHDMYLDTKQERKLYDAEIGLWYRDSKYKPPHFMTPNNKKCFWSRGNGWVFGAMVRVLKLLPKSFEYRQEYVDMYLKMADAICERQQEDGFWYVSLDDNNDYDGPETSGSAFFTYGLAWGINVGLLNKERYLPYVEKAWNALSKNALHDNGLLGYVQGVGECPSSSQPVTNMSTSDFGVGGFLLAGTEVVKLANGEMPAPSPLYVRSVKVEDAQHIIIHYSEKLNMTSACLLDNYKVNGLDLMRIEPCDDKLSVRITMSEINKGRYDLNISNVTGVSNVPVESGTLFSFSYAGQISVSASSYESGTTNTPDKTLDYAFETRWSAEGEGQWLLYDLGKKEVVESVELAFYLGHTRISFFSIELSIDGINFSEVFNGKSGGNTIELENYRFNSQVARYVRITGYGNSISKWNSITQVQINSSEALGIANNLCAEKQNLYCYPNPYSSGSLILRFGYFIEGDVNVEIFNLDGKCCWASKDVLCDSDSLVIDSVDLFPKLYCVVVSKQNQYISGMLRIH